MRKYSGVLAIAVVLIIASTSHASFKLTLDAASTVGVDVLALDGDLDGVIAYSGVVGNFNINVTTAISKPALGSLYEARMDLNSVNVTSNLGDTLTIWVTDTGFTLPAVGPTMQAYNNLGGTTNGTIQFNAYIDTTNAEFGTGTLVNSFSSGAGAYADSGTVTLPLVNPFSLSQKVVITHTAGGQATSFNSEEGAVIPEPGTIAVWSVLMAIIGGGYAVRRNRR